MSANYIYEPIIFEFASSLTSWELDHRFGRNVNIALYDESNIQMEAEIQESSLEVAYVYFYEKGQPVGIKGKAVVS